MKQHNASGKFHVKKVNRQNTFRLTVQKEEKCIKNLSHSPSMHSQKLRDNKRSANVQPMNQPAIYTTCPDCKGRINITKTLQTLQKDIGEEPLPAQLYTTMWCDQCDKGTVALFLQPEKTVDNHTKSNLLEQLLKDVQKPPKAD
jgi:hypothetical protein